MEDMLFFTIKHCQNFTLTKGHGAGVTVGKCMHLEMLVLLFVFAFLRFDPPLSSLSLSLSFLEYFVCLAIGAAPDWC